LRVIDGSSAMTQNTDHEAQSLTAVWNAGIWLSRAAIHFALPEVKVQWQELQQRSAMKEASEALKTLPLQKRTLWDSFDTLLNGAAPVLHARRVILDEAEKALLIGLKAGTYLGVGFEPPRRLSSVPVRIPSQLWQHSPAFDRARLSANSLEFIDIRVLDAPMFHRVIQDRSKTLSSHKVLLPAPEVTPTPAKPGRPSAKPHIEAAFAALEQSGVIDPTKSKRSHYPSITQWITENTSYDGARLSDEGIREHFSPLFEALKHRRKQ
jgi:hypothetical protein